MKTIIKFVFCFIFFLSIHTNAQLDTLNYLKQFEVNKAQYINKPFSYLLGHMALINPKTHWSEPYIKNKNLVKITLFNFYQKEYSFKNAITLSITWKDTFPRSESKYFQNKNSFYFTNEEKTFYENKIIKDIKVYR